MTPSMKVDVLMTCIILYRLHTVDILRLLNNMKTSGTTRVAIILFSAPPEKVVI